MGFRAEVREFIAAQRVQAGTENLYQKTIGTLMSEIAELRKLNRDLLDRVMARNFEELKVFQSEEDSSIRSLTAQDLEPDEDEGNAGDVI